MHVISIKGGINDQSQRWISYHNENKPERPFSDPEVNTLLDKLSN